MEYLHVRSGGSEHLEQSTLSRALMPQTGGYTEV